MKLATHLLALAALAFGAVAHAHEPHDGNDHPEWRFGEAATDETATPYACSMELTAPLANTLIQAGRDRSNLTRVYLAVLRGLDIREMDAGCGDGCRIEYRTAIGGGWHPMQRYAPYQGWGCETYRTDCLWEVPGLDQGLFPEDGLRLEVRRVETINVAATATRSARVERNAVRRVATVPPDAARLWNECLVRGMLGGTIPVHPWLPERWGAASGHGAEPE